MSLQSTISPSTQNIQEEEVPVKLELIGHFLYMPVENLERSICSCHFYLNQLFYIRVHYIVNPHSLYMYTKRLVDCHQCFVQNIFAFLFCPLIIVKTKNMLLLTGSFQRQQKWMLPLKFGQVIVMIVIHMMMVNIIFEDLLYLIFSDETHAAFQRKKHHQAWIREGHK